MRIEKCNVTYWHLSKSCSLGNIRFGATVVFTKRKRRQLYAITLLVLRSMVSIILGFSSNILFHEAKVQNMEIHIYVFFRIHQMIAPYSSTRAASNAVMETVDPDMNKTCKYFREVKVFQLDLLCTKRQPADRPTKHEVVRVIGPLVPPLEGKSSNPTMRTQSPSS